MEFTLYYSPTCFYSLMFLKFIETVPTMAKMITCVNRELYDIDGVQVTPTIIENQINLTPLPNHRAPYRHSAQLLRQCIPCKGGLHHVRPIQAIYTIHSEHTLLV